MPVTLDACLLACKAGMFRQGAEAALALSGEPAWLAGAPPAAVAGVMAHLAPDVALAGEWVAAGGAAEVGEVVDAGNVRGVEGAGGADGAGGGRGAYAPAGTAATGAAGAGGARLPAPELARTTHWPALRRALRLQDADADERAALGALLSRAQAAAGAWARMPHMW